MLQLSQRPLTGTDVDAELFVGRRRELDLLTRAAQLEFNALLLGERGAGTTSLLHQFMRWLRHENVDARFVDASTAGSLDDLLRLVVGELGARAPSDHPSLAELAGSAERLDGEGLVVVVDSVATPALVHELFGQRRDELWDLPFRWVVSGHQADRARYLEPPADAFFDTVVELDELSREDAAALLLRRAGAPGTEDDPDATALRSWARPIAQQVAPRLPRSLLATARSALLAGEDPTVGYHHLAELQQRASVLGRSAAMLFTELMDLGPTSASDDRLLDRLGWTRGRAVQVIKQLEAEGLVVSTTEAGGPSGPGRPRKLYEVNRHSPIVEGEGRG